MKFMDLLYKKYANPFSLLDGYIQTGRFREFVVFFTKQKREDDRWEFFLHKVWHQSYDEFCNEQQLTQELRTMSESTMEATVKESMAILGNFNPYVEEGE